MKCFNCGKEISDASNFCVYCGTKVEKNVTCESTSGITTSPTSSVSPTPPAKPDNFMVWAILSTVFCCVPLGIISIINALDVDKLWNNGNYDGANEAARNAKKWFWWALATGLIFWVIYFIYFLVLCVLGY